MMLVLDNNILFSLMNPFSVASYLFFSIRVEFFAPEFIKLELKKYKELCLFKSKLSEHEFDIRYNEICELIKLFKFPKYENFLVKAANSLQDIKDSPYIALALSINSAIWSNDPHLKQQSLVKVFTTAELVEKLLKNEI
ncbi:MAG: PIN domain-containing protein [Candidatus Woesearchaeota archaeon]